MPKGKKLRKKQSKSTSPPPRTRTMGDHCHDTCTPIGIHYREDRTEDGTININKKQLEDIKDLLKTDEFRYYPAKFYAILSDQLHPNVTSVILEEFRKILIRYPCHICHREIIIALLTVVNVRHLDKLSVKDSFAIEVLTNLSLNRLILNREITALASEIYSKLPYLFSHEPIPGLDLVEIFEHLIVTYGPQWSIYGKDDLKVYRIMITALEIYKYVTVQSYSKRSAGYRPNEQLLIGLVCAFEFYPHIVMAIACNIIKSIKPGYGELCETCCKFYDDLTLLLFEKKAWNKSSYHAVRYVETISELNKTLLRQFPYRRLEIKVISRLDQNVKNILVAAKLLNTYETPALYDIIIQEVSEAVPCNFDLLDDLFALFHDSIRRILSEVRLEFEHIVKIESFEHEQRYAAQGDDSIKLTYTIFEAISRLFTKDLVKRFDLNFLEALISIGRFDKVYFIGRFIVDFIRKILKKKISSKFDILDTTIIAKEILDVSNLFHINSGTDCVHCKLSSQATEQVRQLLIPTSEESVKLANNCTLKQAKSLSYVLRTKNSLIESLHPAGFSLLMEQFCHGECIENLFMISETFRKAKPLLKKGNILTVPTFGKLYDPVKDQTQGDTRVFVLDDGTKIRTGIADLVKNSSFFSNLVNGRFCESSLEEIPIHEITEFEFQFLVKYVHCESWKQSIIVWDWIDMESHVNLIIFCDRLSLASLCQQLVDSLKSTCLTPEVLPTVFEVGATYGIQCLIQGCVDYALAGDIDPELKNKMLRKLFDETSYKEVLASNINQWILRECNCVVGPIGYRSTTEMVIG